MLLNLGYRICLLLKFSLVFERQLIGQEFLVDNYLLLPHIKYRDTPYYSIDT